MSQSFVMQGADRAACRGAARVDPSRTRVLIVDDDTAARRLCASYCDLFDLNCAVARSAPEAAATLRRERFDVVVMNVHMDDGGPADLAALRALDPGRPLIGLTALGRRDEAQRWLAAGLTDVVAKPVTAAKLFAALSAVVAAPADQSRSWAPAV
jgi:CheY-like chemotaxis protein